MKPCGVLAAGSARRATALLLGLLLLPGCTRGERPVRGLWTGRVRVEGVPATRVHVDGEARCLLLRHRASGLRVRLEGTLASGPLAVSVLDRDHARLITTARVPVAGGAFRHELRLSREELGDTSWLSLGFDRAGLTIETLELVEDDVQPRIVVFGLDGATWRILDPLLKAGRLPHIEALARRGVRGTLVSIRPTLSPVVWTTIASGRRPEDHGIRGFVDEEKRLVNSTQVRAKRIWEIASERSPATIGAVGWFVTWPVDPVAGFMLSDRSTPWKTTDKERPLSFHPPELQRPFDQVFEERRERYLAECRRFTSLPLDPDWKTRLPPDDPLRRRIEYLDSRFLRAYLRDSSLAEAGLALFNAFLPDLFFLYLRGSDHAQHAFWFERAPGESTTPVEEEDRRYFGDIIDSYYGYLDEVIGRFVAGAPPDTVFMIVSDHGFRSVVRGPAEQRRSTAYHDLDGVYLISGPGFRKDAHGEPISVLDLCPLWLHELGLPAADDMPGRVPLGLLSGLWPRKPTRIVTYGPRREAAASRSSEEDAELLEQFKALGYIAE